MPKKRPARKPLHEFVRYAQAFPAQARILANFDKRHNPSPMSLREWKWTLAEEQVDILCYVALHGKQNSVCGYLLVGPGSATSVSILNVFVEPELRKCGIGTRLLLTLLGDLTPDVARINFVVPEDDLDLQLFLRTVGFKARLPLKAEAFPGRTNETGIKFTYKITE